jgi:hypothetical protein
MGKEVAAILKRIYLSAEGVEEKHWEEVKKEKCKR